MSVCGTGGWGGPLPGDPDNNSILTASPAFGGIELEWTYPTTNPNAVAHVRLYRNVFPVLETAVPLAIVNGDRYYDKTNSTIRYYYWMRIQSVNGGPLGEAIGPASAVGRPVIEDVLAQLTGMIDAGVLAESLRSDIDSIATNYGELVGEIANRLAGESALSLALANVQAGIDQAMTFIASEVTSRQDGETALIQQIDSLGAVNGAVAAMVATETNARVAADAALASQITAAQVALGDQVAGVEVALQANIDAVDGEVTAIGALYTAKVTVDGLVGGFGVYNDGTLVQAGFDVDTFWVGRTNADKRKPFIIEGGVTYIDEAAINKLTFSKLRDETGSFLVENGKIKADFLQVNSAQSNNFVAGTSGWRLQADGGLEANSGTFRGELSAAAGTLGSITLNNDGHIKSGQTAYNTGIGFFLGYNGATPVFSLGNPTGTRLLWDGTNLTINTPTFDAFTASNSGNISGNNSWDVQSYGSRSAFPSGGKAPYTYRWVLSVSGAYGVMYITNANLQTASFSGANDGRTNTGLATCFISDANGRVAVTTLSISVFHLSTPSG